jgi:succinyl-CoA synthetase beta subunit
VVDGEDDLKAYADSLLGSRLVTPQTGSDGLPVYQLLVEQTLDIDRELYLGMLVDRSARKIVVMASAAGGMNIEEVAATTPEQIHTAHIQPQVGIMPYQGRNLGFALGLKGKATRSNSLSVWLPACTSYSLKVMPHWWKLTLWW